MKFLTNLDLQQNQLIKARIHNLAGTEGVPGVEGQLLYNTVDKYLYLYSNGKWEKVALDSAVAISVADTNTIQLTYTSNTLSANIKAGSVTNSELASMAGNTIKGKLSSSGSPQDLTAADVRTIINVADGAEVNQNAFSIIKVGETEVLADSKTDTLELIAGANVTLTPNPTNDSITIASQDTIYTHPTYTTRSIDTDGVEVLDTFTSDGEGHVTDITKRTLPNATQSAAGVMSSADKTKLDGIEAGAEVNVQSDWTESNSASDAFIKNKPTLGTAASKNTGTAEGEIPILGTNGKLATSTLPALAITDTFVVNSENAMLALTAEVGDVAVRTDLSKSFILVAEPASTLGNWQELLTPADAVSSVNGYTGAVTLDFTDVGAAAASHTHGNITNDGKIGTTSGLAVVTGTDGLLTTGTVAATTGGTGLAAYTTGDILYASATNTLAALPVGSDGQILKIASGVPTWGADNDTTYTAGNGIGLSGTTFSVAAGSGLTQETNGLAHAATSSLSGQQGTQGISNITLDSFGHITAVSTTTYMRRYAETLSTSATSYVITHSLGTRDVMVTVRETAEDYEQVFCDVEFTSNDTITLRFAQAPAENEYRVTVIG